MARRGPKLWLLTPQGPCLAVVVAGARKMLEVEAGRSFLRNTHTTKVGPHIVIGPGALGYALPAVIGVAETLCQPMPRPSRGAAG